MVLYSCVAGPPFVSQFMIDSGEVQLGGEADDGSDETGSADKEGGARADQGLRAGPDWHAGGALARGEELAGQQVVCCKELQFASGLFRAAHAL
jgi:hypothetical protein